MSSARRIFALSDVHTDIPENWAWLTKNLQPPKYSNDILIVAGDVSDDLIVLRKTLQFFKGAFSEVFFVPGNHDLWVKLDPHLETSFTKLTAILETCKSLNVKTNPENIDGVWIVPLLSWYHFSWDREPDIHIPQCPPIEKCMNDFRHCRWPKDHDVKTEAIAKSMDERNFKLSDYKINPDESTVISFSHFLPYQELLPEKRYLFLPGLPKVVGSDYLAKRIEALRPHLHVFGHSHIGWDTKLKGTRFVHAPVAYPNERLVGMHGGENFVPYLVYTYGEGLASVQETKWGSHYASNARNPDDLSLAPWVKKKWNIAD